MDGIKFLGIPQVGKDPKELGYVAGGIFITNVEPVDSAKVVELTTVASPGMDLISYVKTDTTLVKVTCLWEGTSEDWVGTVKVNGLEISTANIVNTPGTRLFTGHVNVELDFDLEVPPMSLITANHSSGRSTHIYTELLPVGPNILSVTFGALPSGQTELKAGDFIDVTIRFNTSDVASFAIADYGASEGVLQENVVLDGTNHITIQMPIADRGNTLTQQPIRIVGYNSFGTAGDMYTSGTLPLNNLYPTLTYGGVGYPSGQEALKDNELSNFAFSYTNGDAIHFSSTELTITDPATLTSPKSVHRSSGNYRVSGSNLTGTITRNANGASVTKDQLIKIAHTAAVVNFLGTSTRLITGGSDGTSPQQYSYQFNSSQLLIESPTLTAPQGVMSAITGSGSHYSFMLTVTDTDPRGVFSWSSFSAKNLAGRITTSYNGNNTYEIGGFVMRTLTVAVLSRTVAFTPTVSNVTKLQVTNLSKGASGSLNTTYKSTKVDEVDRYTIVDSNEDLDPNGNYWYNLDKLNSESNTTGTMQIEIAETA